jgi:hypothetical protein
LPHLTGLYARFNLNIPFSLLKYLLIDKWEWM